MSLDEKLKAVRRRYGLQMAVDMGKVSIPCEDCRDWPVDIRTLLRMQCGSKNEVVPAICPRCRAKRRKEES